MKQNKRLSNEEYEALSLEYEQNPPELSGMPGFFTIKREHFLVSELLSSDYARIVKAKADVLSISPSEVIQYALKAQLAESI